jgi:hypothetical protein
MAPRWRNEPLDMIGLSKTSDAFAEDHVERCQAKSAHPFVTACALGAQPPAGSADLQIFLYQTR